MAMVVQVLFRLLALLPRTTLQSLGGFIGWVSYQTGRRSALVTRENLQLCCPGADQEARVRASLAETGKTAMEMPAIWLGNPQKLDRWIAQVHDEALFTRALKSEKGLLLLLPHLGNWELFNIFYRRYGKMTAMYQPPRRDTMRSVMAEVRTRHGNRMVPANRQGLTALYKTLQDGGSVVVLPDQVPASGVYTPFFDQMALTDSLSSRLLRKTGAQALGVAVIRRPDGRFDIHFIEPAAQIYESAPEALLAINRLVEAAVGLAPDQYQWEYKRFKRRPAGERKLYRFGKPDALHLDG